MIFESLKKFLPPKKETESALGIDIGTSTIRVVELVKRGEQEELKNYALVSLLPTYRKPVRELQKDTWLLSPTEIAKILNSVLREAGIRTKETVFSIPDFATFFTSFSLPPMSKEEMSQAVKFEARRHVPLPLSEVTLDWIVIKDALADNSEGSLEILLVVVPNDIIDQHTKIAELCNLDLLALEAEVFGLFRALDRSDKKTIGLIEIGSQSTTCSIVDQKQIKFSHSFDIGGSNFTERLSKSLNLNYQAAESLKKRQGILEGSQNTKDVLIPLFDLILSEIGKVVDNFYKQAGKEIETYILAGNSALLPGLKQYFAQTLKKEIKLAHPFVDMMYPPVLEEIVKEIGPGFAIAAGMALKKLKT